MNALYRHPSTTPPSAPARVRIGDDRFVSDATLDGWLRSGDATPPPPLHTTRDGRRFVLRDAVRILGRRNGETDPYGFTGRVETLREFVRQGAILASDSVRLGPAVYDAEYGVVAYPMASPDESGANPKVG